jgi:GH15 family glucan-1,4-alpha-glucosidase
MRPALKTKSTLMKTIPLRLARKHLALAVASALIPWLAAAGPSRSANGPGRAAEAQSRSLELSRPIRPWEFLCAVGTRAGLLGNEAGRMEAWVYPLKLLRDFRLQFHTEGRVLPAETLARTLITRPESSTIVYTGDTFSVRETFFVPVNEPGAVILLEVETEFPLEIEARFLRDFQLEWPAALGGTYSSWDKDQRAFYLGEETKKFAAFVGSPTATEARPEYQTNYSESAVNSFRLGVTNKGKDTKLIVIAGSLDGRPQAEATYKKLAGGYADLLRASAEYYKQYLKDTVSVELPDAQIQQAYDWSRVSMVQGIVSNPFLGTGLVAGYRTSGESQRPGFAWFFGRDSLWTSLALNAAGDFATTRMALQFISKYQREDGKMPHEIAQGASFVPWFKDFPYGYASADATPLYIIAMNDYVTESGDVAFAKEKWDSVWKAYQFLRSTYDEQGFPKNFGIGHGWVEGGPLLPIKSEFYQSGLGAEALSALSNLARLTGKDAVATELTQAFEKQASKANDAFWLADKQRFAFALGIDGKPVDEASVLATVPMWFGLPDQKNASAMITQLAGADHQTDWGMRIISSRSPKFSGGGYHYGSVWPLFTGWASVGEYRYHRPQPAYANLRANALLALDGSLGHVTEVLSGDYYQPLSTSSPHQIWSAAMVVSPLLRGMFGLSTDAKAATLTFAPHLPADWNSLGIDNLRVGENKLRLNFTKTLEGISLEALRTAGTGESKVEFRPSISLRAAVQKVEVNGKPLPFRVEANDEDQHVVVRFPVSEEQKLLRIFVLNDFAVTATQALPPLGSVSTGMRILSETWSASHDQLTLDVSGTRGAQYELKVWNAAQIGSVEGAQLKKKPDGSVLALQIPDGGSEGYAHAKIVIHFSDAQNRGKHR